MIERPEPRSEPEDEPLREEDVTAVDRLDDRVEEGDGLPERPYDRELDGE